MSAGSHKDVAQKYMHGRACTLVPRLGSGSGKASVLQSDRYIKSRRNREGETEVDLAAVNVAGLK